MNPSKDGEEHAFVGLSTGYQKKLAVRNDPVAFCDKLRNVMAGEEGGMWAMPEDHTAADGTSRLPQADSLTPMRVECRMKLVSPNLATRAVMVPGTVIEVYPVQGGRARIPFNEVTITDWTRLLVTEVFKQGGTRDTARYALKNIKLAKGEAWMSASTKLVLHMRAALVDHTRPYASEEQHFWRFITEADLMTLVDRALNLFLSPVLDRMSLESYVVLVHKEITAQLAHRPVDVSHPNSDYMVQRGIVSSKCFNNFVYDLSSRANRYHPGTDMALVSNDRSLGAVGLRSLKKTLDERDDDHVKPKSRLLGRGSPPGRSTPLGR